MLSTAVERGDWVLLEGANRCPAAVLDRLNPLLEPHGSLLLNEAGEAGGQARILTPHANFRLFLTVDPGCVCGLHVVVATTSAECVCPGEVVVIV